MVTSLDKIHKNPIFEIKLEKKYFRRFWTGQIAISELNSSKDIIKI